MLTEHNERLKEPSKVADRYATAIFINYQDPKIVIINKAIIKLLMVAISGLCL